MQSDRLACFFNVIHQTGKMEVVREIDSSAHTYWNAIDRAVLIIEDHHIVREAMRHVVGQVRQGGRLDVFEASTFAEARRMVIDRDSCFDLVLLDVDLPDADGAVEIECLRHDWADQPVVVSGSEDWKMAVEFLRAGALGFIPKRQSLSVMVNALSLIVAGGRYFPNEVFGLLSTRPEPDSAVADPADEDQEEEDLAIHLLSPRQRDALRLIGEGYSNKEIARTLGVSLGTAKNYVAAVLRAFNTNSRAKAVLLATKQGLDG